MFIKMLFFSFLVMSISGATTAQDEVTKILILGDSLTEGYGVDSKYSYPSKLQNIFDRHKRKYKVINGGISGSTTASGVSRLKWFFKASPKILIIALGANDGLRGIKVKESKKNLEKIILMAKEKKIKIILAGMKMPPNYGKEYIKEFHSIYPALAKKHSLFLIPFLISDVAGKRELNIDDGIHPNKKGHEILAKTVYDFLIKKEII